MVERAVATKEQMENQLRLLKEIRETYCDQIAMLVHADNPSLEGVGTLLRELADVQASIHAFEAVIADRGSKVQQN